MQDENSEYWINKFGSLIGGIGKVIAIVADWEDPVTLTRIWYLFELNAAIDTGAELKFVATGSQRQDLSMNLKRKFDELDQVVSRIDARSCDAKRPHEIQDKAIFLGKLRGIEDEVNAKLRQELRRWLCDAAEGVICRTDPRRPRLDGAAIAMEVAEIGDRWWERLEMERRFLVFPTVRMYGEGARLTRCWSGCSSWCRC